jgi:hypothetical protein
MNPLRIELTKSADGGALLRCMRPDGSVTWQKQGGKQALFFPLHDLTHFAVETILQTKTGFYGLIASGWDIADTTGKGAKGPLSDEALAVEHLVGMLDAERASGTTTTAAQLSEYASGHAKANDLKPQFTLTDEILERIRSRAGDLHSQWRMLSPGVTMPLEFQIG